MIYIYLQPQHQPCDFEKYLRRLFVDNHVIYKPIQNCFLRGVAQFTEP